ncbi:hypothetical protein C8R44DRAFT_889431 [Mycena epipterygia]|nr:hypothetical protein C8R44DRAFT_889431 [Mycena epipterygia]
MSMAPTASALIPFLLLTLVMLSPVHAALTNITIDDSDSSHFTWIEGDLPGETPPWAAITPSTPCMSCSARPQSTNIFNQTWHDGRNNSAGSFTFQGSAVYIYGIDLANPANISFTMDDGTSAFHYYSGSAPFVFKSLFFSASNLPSGVNHTVSWVLHATQTNGITGLFDYAVITADASTVSSSSATQSPTGSTAPSTHKHKSTAGPIVGGVVCGLALIALITLALGLLARRRRRRGNDPAAVVRPFVVPGASGSVSVEPNKSVGRSGSGGEKILDVSWVNPQPLPLPTLAAGETAPHPSTTDLSATTPSAPSAPSATNRERSRKNALSTPSAPSTRAQTDAPSTYTTERERVLEERLALLEAQVGQHLALPPPYGTSADA